MSTPQTGPSPTTVLEAIRTRLRRLGTKAATSEQLAADDREARDAAIEEAEHVHGLTIRQIAEEVGLSRQRVHRVVLDREAVRQAGARLRAEGRS
jgi:hypothetical protein